MNSLILEVIRANTRASSSMCIYVLDVDVKNVILPVFSRQNLRYSELMLECILFPTYQILSLLRTVRWIQYYRSR